MSDHPLQEGQWIVPRTGVWGGGYPGDFSNSGPSEPPAILVHGGGMPGNVSCLGLIGLGQGVGPGRMERRRK